MPFIVTSIHDPVALAATCRQLSLPAPKEGCIPLEAYEASGWIVRLPGVLYPIVCDVLTGLLAYHPRDNAFGRYAKIANFIRRYYDIRHRLRQGRDYPCAGRSAPRKFRRPVLVECGR